jgi:phage-related baseplate assembly protein
MAIKPTDKNFGSNRNINYVGKDFATLKQNLIDYTKTYFPNTYSDFNEASPGMVFIEQAAAIGDVLSFYQDTQLKESMLVHASERKNVVALAQAMGYKPKISTPAVTTLTIYQLVPSKIITGGGGYEPDESYCLRIKEGMEVSSNSNSNVIFRTIDVVDFSLTDGREVDVETRNSFGEPQFYLLTKKVKAISATEREQSFTFSTYQDYPKITLTDDNIISVSSIMSNSGTTKWYEVPYLAQESVFIEKANTEANGGELSNSSSVVPYILEVQKVPYRFTTKVNSDNTLDIQFGNGDTRLNDEQILPNTKNIGLGLANSVNRLNQGIDPSNFLKTNTFGVAPNASNGTLVVKYLIGGGITSNVNAEDLTRISKIEFDEDLISIDNPSLYSEMKQSIAVENLEPAVGGRGAETIEEIRQNALATFGSQNRAVTREDYIVRALSMPERYGSVAKVYVSPDGEVDNNSPSSILASPNNIAEFVGVVEGLQGKTKSEIQTELVKYLSQKKTAIAEVNNPFAINMYILGYDVNKHLTQINQAVKQNLKTYLGEYRMITDAVNIIDGFIVNIGVDFEIVCYSNYNKREVLSNCLTDIQNYFNIDNWTFNKPINISEIELILANVEGVMSVPSVKIHNLCKSSTNGENYSSNRYNIDEATKGKMVYPSLDPCIFEVKYPNKDIKGRAL